jgi:hypothetical protein
LPHGPHPRVRAAIRYLEEALELTTEILELGALVI